MAHQRTYLKDYQAPSFQLPKTELSFEITNDRVRAQARISFRRCESGKQDALVLQGEHLTLRSVRCNEASFENYEIGTETLTLLNLPDEGVLEFDYDVDFQKNQDLMGMYRVSDTFLTQCEPQGFRRICYFLDRPDVMSSFLVSITSEKQKYPHLLCNGDRVLSEDLPHGYHRVVWHDPHLKPGYLFALVAGNFEHVQDTFVRANGRSVVLDFYVEPGFLSQCAFALQALKDAMRWDEQAFGREYDLDRYQIVATSHFNMGAMENKGLNVFNVNALLGNSTMATDEDLKWIHAVVGHEYFHNWTGNRITCRDWFQLSLKEGLTVYREQKFCEDSFDRGIERIHQVQKLRERQFKEDAGPTAHSVQPDSYLEIDNFYTATIYEKGSEIIRMVEQCVGPQSFRKGMDKYFEKYDGQAVTIQDLIRVLLEDSSLDVDHFLRWYEQVGTPKYFVVGSTIQKIKLLS